MLVLIMIVMLVLNKIA